MIVLARCSVGRYPSSSYSVDSGNVVPIAGTGNNYVARTMQVFLLCVCACAALAAAFPAPQMTDAQLEQALSSRVTIEQHLKCALDQAPCDPVGRRLKTLAPLVLRGACPQCTSKETWQIRRTLAFIQRNYPAEWAKIVRRFG